MMERRRRTRRGVSSVLCQDVGAGGQGTGCGGWWKGAVCGSSGGGKGRGGRGVGWLRQEVGDEPLLRLWRHIVVQRILGVGEAVGYPLVQIR